MHADRCNLPSLGPDVHPTIMLATLCYGGERVARWCNIGQSRAFSFEHALLRASSNHAMSRRAIVPVPCKRTFALKSIVHVPCVDVAMHTGRTTFSPYTSIDRDDNVLIEIDPIKRGLCHRPPE